MDWSIERRNDALIARPAGRIDESNWQDFGSRLGEAITTAAFAGLERVIVDLGALAYMSSRGLRALTLARRDADTAGVAIQLAAPNDVMREILAISRYDKLFDVIDGVPDAN